MSDGIGSCESFISTNDVLVLSKKILSALFFGVGGVLVKEFPKILCNRVFV